MKYRQVFILFWLGCLLNADETFAQRCVRGNCEKGFGTQILGPNSRYTGEFVNGMREGRGIFYFANGNKYLGEWKKNKMDGEGKLIYANGNEFVGSFKNDKINGKGTMSFKNGDRYTGEWMMDLPNGYGTYYFAKGDRYEGQFAQGKLHGRGSFYYKDGSKYVGEWSANKRHGYGEYTSAEGKLSMGQWEHDKLVRVLEESKPEAGKHLAQQAQTPAKELDEIVEPYIRDEPDASLPAKQTRQEGKPSPKPNTPPAGEQHAGNRPNTPASNEELLPDCNKVYCKQGQGVLLYADGSRYVGAFVDGEPRGKGICYYANGDRYEGMWANHAPHGEGIMYFNSGLVYGAVWEYGTAKKQIFDMREFEFNEQVKIDKSPEVKIWAVVVGIARYEHMPALKYSDDDAYKIYAFLKSPEGGALKDNQIRVLIDEDATRHQILKAMHEVLTKADENDVIMMYYSGHGLEGTFLPIDYNGFANSIHHNEIKEIFSKSAAKHKVCFADACHSGSLLAAKAPFSSSLMYFYDELDKESGGTAFFMSSKGKEYSLEDGGLRQGIFSHFLIRGLKGEADFDRNKTITLKELYNYVSVKVRDYTGNAQTPMIAGDYNENMPVAFVRED